MTATMAKGRSQVPAQAVRLLAGISGAAMLAGCVQVSTPDRPIEVNLNINIRQEVVVRLQQDARELIEREQRDY